MKEEGQTYSIEDWIIDNDMEELQEEIETHLSEYMDNIEDTSRLIMISIRQKLEDRGFDSAEE